MPLNITKINCIALKIRSKAEFMSKSQNIWRDNFVVHNSNANDMRVTQDLNSFGEIVTEEREEIRRHTTRYDNVTLSPLVLQWELRFGPIQRNGANQNFRSVVCVSKGKNDQSNLYTFGGKEITRVSNVKHLGITRTTNGKSCCWWLRLGLYCYIGR
jgi:hypothetical protein